MTVDQASSAASTQLKEQMKQRLTQGIGVAAKAAGQQAGTLAQAVRQTGEEMRQQGQEGQGKLADKIAAPIQRLSGTLSQADPESVTDVTTLKPTVTAQAEQLKTKATSQLRIQAQTRTAAAADGVNAVSAGVRQVGDQLRAQGQQTPALVLEALAEKIEPLGGYLSTADPDQLRSDVTAYGRKAQAKINSASAKLTERQQVASAKVSQAGKATVEQVRSKPALPIAGALSVAALVAVRLRKGKAQTQDAVDASAQTDTTPVADSTNGSLSASGPAEERLSLTRAQLRDQAVAAGLEVTPDMSKRELMDALDGR